MTPDERERLAALAEAATPGPWEVMTRHRDFREVVWVSGAEATLDQDMDSDLPDAAFIAAAREAVPALLAALAKAEARANEAARLSAEARDKADDAERRWIDHQDVCVMASLDRETLETERDRYRRQVEAVRALHARTNGYSNGDDFDCCAVCFDADEQPEAWPCPTVRAIGEENR